MRFAVAVFSENWLRFPYEWAPSSTKGLSTYREGEEMKNRGTRRRTVAAWIVAACLVLAIPGSADARWFSEPSVRGQGQEEANPEQAEARQASFWSSLWDRLENFWGKGVWINPEGGESDDDTGNEGGGDGDDTGGSQGDQTQGP